MSIKNYIKFLLLPFITICIYCSSTSYSSVIKEIEEGKSTIKVLTTLDEHRTLLKEVLDQATKRVVIVSPYISSWALTADDIVETLQDKPLEISIFTDLKLDQEYNNKTLKPNAKIGRRSLRKALVDFRVLNKIHAKILIKDDDLIAIGSFNWLSAVRDSNSQYSNHEQSILVQGSNAENLIETSLRGILSVTEIKTPYSRAYDTTETDKSDGFEVTIATSRQEIYENLSFEEQREFTDLVERLAKSSSSSNSSSDNSDKDSSSDTDRLDTVKDLYEKGRKEYLHKANNKRGNDGSSSDDNSYDESDTE